MAVASAPAPNVIATNPPPPLTLQSIDDLFAPCPNGTGTVINLSVRAPGRAAPAGDLRGCWLAG